MIAVGMLSQSVINENLLVLNQRVVTAFQKNPRFASPQISGRDQYQEVIKGEVTSATIYTTSL
jgi:hypothetical protein